MGADTIRARPTVRRIGLADLKDALARGLADFSAIPTHAVFLCLIYPIVGLVLARAILGYALLPLLFPLAAGFAHDTRVDVRAQIKREVAARRIRARATCAPSARPLRAPENAPS